MIKVHHVIKDIKTLLIIINLIVVVNRIPHFLPCFLGIRIKPLGTLLGCHQVFILPYSFTLLFNEEKLNLALTYYLVYDENTSTYFKKKKPTAEK